MKPGRLSLFMDLLPGHQILLLLQLESICSLEVLNGSILLLQGILLRFQLPRKIIKSLFGPEKELYMNLIQLSHFPMI